MKDWRSVALVALVSLLLGRESAQTQSTTNMTTVEPVDPRSPISVRIVDPIPVILVAPVGPRPTPPDPTPSPPGPVVDPAAPDTPLAQVGRTYLRMIPFGLPEVWNHMADQIERGEIVDKAGAVQAHGKLSSSLNTALDQVFAAGMDAKGKIVNKSAIVIQLRQGAAALGRRD